jgi:hypothetical protein
MFQEASMETVPNTFPWMFYGYLAIWGVLVMLILSMLARIRSIERTIQSRTNEADKYERPS